MRSIVFVLFSCLLLAACVSPAPLPGSQSSSTPSIPTPSGGVPTPSSGIPSPTTGGSSGGDSSPTPSPTGGGVQVPIPVPGGSSGGDGGTPGDQGGDSSDGSDPGSSGDSDTAGAEDGATQTDSDGGGSGSAGDQPSEYDEAGEQVGDDGQPTFEDVSPSASSSAGGSLEDLEAILDEELGTFDGQILDEQENARQSSGGNGGLDAGDPSGGGIIGEFESFPSPEGQQQVGAPGSNAGGNTPITLEDIPPPDPDDDIVARQLREAALAEPDPDIQAALWEEYYKYKDGQR